MDEWDNKNNGTGPDAEQTDSANDTHIYKIHLFPHQNVFSSSVSSPARIISSMFFHNYYFVRDISNSWNFTYHMINRHKFFHPFDQTGFLLYKS